MMHYASPGVRNVARKGSNVLIHGHSGPGVGTSNGQTSRPIHLFSILDSLHPPHLPLMPTLVRNPSHRLFSASKNILQKFFSHLTAPGLRAPVHFSGQIPRASTRSLHNAIRGTTIQSSLSLPARHALRTNALQRQANTFLPCAPNPAPPRFGGVTQVGLGTARNFSSARPIFQHLAENVPVAGRALYEIDWDVEMRKEHERMRLRARNEGKKVRKTKEMIKPTQKVEKFQPLTDSNDKVSTEDVDHYFAPCPTAAVTTYLLIPLAPTPTLRAPLPANPTTLPTSAGWEPTLLPPLSYLGNVHRSHSTHALRVSTLFTRLDQANVWSRGGVHCAAYSQGQAHRRLNLKPGGMESDEGVCTILRVEFVGWTQAEVRSVIGESGSGWCILEEVAQDGELNDDDAMSDMDSLSSGLYEDETAFTPHFTTDIELDNSLDIAQSFILPTIDVSSTSIYRSRSLESVLSSLPSEMESDPWVDEYSASSRSSSYSDLADLIVDPPSSNGWFDAAPVFGPGVYSQQGRRHWNGEEIEPQEGMFY
ncbi:hypothetical protein CVT25_001062 [Psilocybe cyanescens]|uniref:Uncharacterized protein n=1 Tax=Psilocybe cyanescens TaxID=93625 RepID=A0A409XB06_PSICY|nr:hypothetical protein CVT25_001062 [Psilocybe cyanescens]